MLTFSVFIFLLNIISVFRIQLFSATITPRLNLYMPMSCRLWYCCGIGALFRACPWSIHYSRTTYCRLESYHSNALKPFWCPMDIDALRHSNGGTLLLRPLFLSLSPSSQPWLVNRPPPLRWVITHKQMQCWRGLKRDAVPFQSWGYRRELWPVKSEAFCLGNVI